MIGVTIFGFVQIEQNQHWMKYLLTRALKKKCRIYMDGTESRLIKIENDNKLLFVLLYIIFRLAE